MGEMVGYRMRGIACVPGKDMSTQTSIEWTERTWNPAVGCSKLSPGCAHCYAEVMARRLQAMRVKGYKNGFEGTLLPNSIHWVIVGGESGLRARLMQQDWALNIKHQCDEQRSAFIFRQWGGWGVDGKKRAKIVVGENVGCGACVNNRYMHILNASEADNIRCGIKRAVQSLLAADHPAGADQQHRRIL